MIIQSSYGNVCLMTNFSRFMSGVIMILFVMFLSKVIFNFQSIIKYSGNYIIWATISHRVNLNMKELGEGLLNYFNELAFM